MKSPLVPLWLLCLTQGQALVARNPVDNHGAEAQPHATSLPDSFNILKKRVDADVYETLTTVTTYASSDVIPVSETVSVKTSAVPSGTVQILPKLDDDIEPQTTGIIITKISSETEGHLLTSSIPSPTSLLKPIKPTKAVEDRSIKEQPVSGAHRLVKMAAAVNIFDTPVDTKAPPSSIGRRSDHPVPRQGITKNGPLHTNKFYANFFLDDQASPVFTFPYSLRWANGAGATASYGMSLTHIDAKQRVFGEVQYNGAAKFYNNPIDIQSIVISAKELGKGTVIKLNSLTQNSARVHLHKSSSSAATISFPVVQGMGYVTAQYAGATPVLQSGVYFKSMTKVSKAPKTNVVKYTLILEDGTTWRVYAYKSKGDQLDLQVINNGLLQAKTPFYGLLQVVKDPKTTGSEALLDDGAGIYPSSVALSGSTSGTVGTYSFTFAKAGHPTGNLYMFALPHHVDSFDSTTKSLTTSFKMQTTTKGIATLVKGTSWTMVEPNMNTGLGFAPWSPSKKSVKTLSTAAKKAITPIALSEVSQDMSEQSDLNSMYFSGKVFSKFASVLYVINDILKDTGLAQAGLVNLKAAFAKFASNKQQYPLYYESAWGGVVSSASYSTGDRLADFGNSYYNDHHFHWGYHIFAASVIGYLDSTWLAANKDYVNTLVRDIANPSTKDTYFPQWRNFDWYHGHSWAKGLTASWDGKDQESSSEDVMSVYAIRMWAKVIKDTNLEKRCDLQLAVLTRSIQNYYLYQSDNKVQPSQFIGNKVAGILFENKIDHTTYFSPDIEAIQGIHMIPVMPFSASVRTSKFITEEWNAFFSNGRIDDIDNGWKGIAYANYASVNPKTAWDFFNQNNFSSAWLDGGASQTWYMAYSAALGGA